MKAQMTGQIDTNDKRFQGNKRYYCVIVTRRKMGVAFGLDECSPTGGSADAMETSESCGLREEERCESTDWLRTFPLMARLKVSKSPDPSALADCGEGG